MHSVALLTRTPLQRDVLQFVTSETHLPCNVIQELRTTNGAMTSSAAGHCYFEGPWTLIAIQQHLQVRLHLSDPFFKARVSNDSLYDGGMSAIMLLQLAGAWIPETPHIYRGT